LAGLHRDEQKDYMLRTLTRVSTFAVLMLAAVAAQAQPADYRTYFTFSAPVTLPDVTLPAGTYLFRLADPNTSRKVINVLSQDGKRSLAMVHTIPNQLLRAPQNPEIRFMEASANTPPPIKTWWYPGKSIGYEFIYPRAQALALAKVTSEPVLTTAAETRDLETADLSRITGTGPPAAVTVDDNPAPVALASGRVQQGEVVIDATSTPVLVTQQARADDGAAVAPRTTLPQTASSVPTVAVFGGAALVAGLALLLWRRPQFTIRG
jgi:LPXTG-motif cell wall-anchored protein